MSYPAWAEGLGKYEKVESSYHKTEQLNLTAEVLEIGNYNDKVNALECFSLVSSYT